EFTDSITGRVWTAHGNIVWIPDPALSGGFFTLDGVAGTYISTPDVNLLDADTAHLQQSGGPYINSSLVLTERTEPPDFTPSFGSKAIRYENIGLAGANKRTGMNKAIAVDGSTEYTLTIRVLSEIETVGMTLRMDINEYDSGTGVTGQFFLFDEAITPNVEQDLSITFTTQAATEAIGWHIWLRDAVIQTDEGLWVDTGSLREGTDATFLPSLRVVGDLSQFSKLASDDWGNGATRQHFIDNASGNDGYFSRGEADLDLAAAHGTGTDP
ncbi:unnamed protein product, partial [marine sediment metagenome]